MQRMENLKEHKGTFETLGDRSQNFCAYVPQRLDNAPGASKMDSNVQLKRNRPAATERFLAETFVL